MADITSQSPKRFECNLGPEIGLEFVPARFKDESVLNLREWGSTSFSREA
jgi:hypothetical protein